VIKKSDIFQKSLQAMTKGCDFKGCLTSTISRWGHWAGKLSWLIE
jgi:hypothetical protein